jgi:hypothetical protein
MDIFELAKTYGEADYLDVYTGNIYLIGEYNRAKRFGLPNVYGGIRVADSVTGAIIGVVREEDQEK